MTNQEAIEELQYTIDLIKQDGKDWLDERDIPVLEMAISALEKQPEIIHCKECKYGVQDEDKWWYCRGFGCQVGEEDGSGFCADAERKNNV